MAGGEGREALAALKHYSRPLLEYMYVTISTSKELKDHAYTFVG